MAATRKIAVLSDTHGLLRPDVLEACSGVDAILHAGDVGDPSILDRLREIAPVTAIRGNIDTAGPCGKLPPAEMVPFGSLTVYMVHSLADLDISPASAGVQVVISGHSHKYAEDTRHGVLYLNPGSVGPRRFRLPTTMAYLHVSGMSVRVERVEFAI